MKRAMIAVTIFFGVMSAAMAQESNQVTVHESGPFVQVLSSVLPILFVFLILWLVITLTMKKNRPYQKRATEHMDRIEQKYDRIIELLEKLTTDKK